MGEVTTKGHGRAWVMELFYFLIVVFVKQISKNLTWKTRVGTEQ